MYKCKIGSHGSLCWIPTKIGCKVHSYWLRLFEEAMNLVFFSALLRWLHGFIDFTFLLLWLSTCVFVLDMLQLCRCCDEKYAPKHARTWYKHEFLLVRVRIYAFENYDKPHGVKYACCIRLGKEYCSFYPTTFLCRKKKNVQEWDRERKSNIKKITSK